MDTPIAPSGIGTDVDIPPLQHAFCRSELGGRDAVPLEDPEQSGVDGDVPPRSAGQDPRGSDNTQGNIYLEVVIPGTLIRRESSHPGVVVDSNDLRNANMIDRWLLNLLNLVLFQPANVASFRTRNSNLLDYPYSTPGRSVKESK